MKEVNFKIDGSLEYADKVEGKPDGKEIKASFCDKFKMGEAAFVSFLSALVYGEKRPIKRLKASISGEMKKKKFYLETEYIPENQEEKKE